ncbi:hypothetical protein E2562_017650 [Oryza meyeriana var. granulata]|uniref:Disease resistance N-terminal domain-containing protein n=1 Tax=Oryza meyeriana var. granulata TaxID=110450 RepID=A0A6G1BXR8_9ORYZ|nr:hypothetical protein E2562_017650 [Oryza meyeriana var. granulata]
MVIGLLVKDLKEQDQEEELVLNLAMDKVVGILRGAAGLAADTNAFHEFFNWVTPRILAAFHSHQQLQVDSGGTGSASAGDNRTAALHQIQDDLQKLEHNLWVIQSTITSTMYDLIDHLEWHSHKEREARHLRQIKDAVYDAEDLLDEYNYYALKVKKFDRLVRPETCRVLDEPEIFGREKELKELTQMLGVRGRKRD